MPSDIEIARAAELRPIEDVAARLGLEPASVLPHGRHIAKIDLSTLPELESRRDGKLVLVTAISPTPAGEGKTTTTVGLGDGLSRIGRKAAICLREPSLGPCFGMKGGAAGGGYAQVVPMEQINLHFTGDFHAITSAHNLLSALIDNHVYWGNALDLDLRRITWRRVVDMNDRALREIVTSLGGVANGFPREAGFDITVASEVMAILCLARDLTDLGERLSRIVIGQTRDRRQITAGDIDAAGAMTVLLKDALLPNLVQTMEGTPAFVHGGPFANIAHGCNTLIATRTALKLADFVVTEAGFGADLGAEKFIDIKCRQGGLRPDVAVVVATVRALKHHGGVGRDAYGKPDTEALERGFANLERHVANLRKFSLRSIVAINRFHTDSPEELALLRELCRDRLGVEAVVCSHFADGSAGAEELATRVAAMCEEDHDTRAHFLYPEDMPLWDKLRTVAREIYGAADISAAKSVRDRFRELEDRGYGHLPVCVAKTQYSFSSDPTATGAPSGHIVPVRELRLAGGAGFVVAVCGDIMTMPGLPRNPSAAHIRVDEDGLVQGLS
ncbi:formate--tetrahydrofolate ligase [Geminicoccaceae bacterium 1502E]|nr:formate--tetrahydrofolate ligase [Geminicoccaceae bacterium 1502E]